MHYDFEKDLPVGQSAEDEIVTRLQAMFPTCSFDRCANNAYDIAMTHQGRQTTLEIKHDLLAETTGNLAFEYRCRGKWSGINTTQAASWVYKFKMQHRDCLLFLKTAVLRAMLKAEPWRSVRGGDDNAAEFMVVPVETAITWGTLV